MVGILGIESLFAAGGSAADLLAGGAGADSLSGGSGADTLQGGAGDDSLEGGAGDVLTGGEGNDALLVTGLPAALDPGAGNDTVTAQSGAAGIAFSTGLGNDRVSLEAAGATVSLDAGNDTVVAVANNAGIDAGSGTADVLELDLARLAEAVELAFTGAGSGYMAAGTAHRVDWDEVERIRAVGGAGADLLEGGAAADTLEGGGAYTLRGGTGSDIFRLDLAGAEGDRLADFNGRGAQPGDSILFLGFGTGGTVTALGGGAYLVAGSLGSATISISGRPDPTDYAFATG